MSVFFCEARFFSLHFLFIKMSLEVYWEKSGFTEKHQLKPILIYLNKTMTTQNSTCFDLYIEWQNFKILENISKLHFELKTEIKACMCKGVEMSGILSLENLRNPEYDKVKQQNGLLEQCLKILYSLHSF